MNYSSHSLVEKFGYPIKEVRLYIGMKRAFDKAPKPGLGAKGSAEGTNVGLIVNISAQMYCKLEDLNP